MGLSGCDVWISEVLSPQMWCFQTNLIHSNLLEFQEAFSRLSEKAILSFIIDISAWLHIQKYGPEHRAAPPNSQEKM